MLAKKTPSVHEEYKACDRESHIYLRFSNFSVILIKINFIHVIKY